MAKRRRRKRKQSFEISVSLYAILFILIAVFGICKFGPAGRMIASISMFLTGSLYVGFLVILLLIGVYTLFKGEWPDFFSTKMLGIYLLVIGILTFMHWDFITDEFNSNQVFKTTVEHLNIAFKNIMNNGAIGENVIVGGGFIGGIFAIMFAKLFSYTGMEVVTVIFIVGGVCLFTGFSIVEFLKNRLQDFEDAKNNHSKDKDEEEKDGMLNKKVKISNGNEIEEDNKKEINPEELKKNNSVETTPVVEEVHTSNTVNPLS